MLADSAAIMSYRRLSTLIALAVLVGLVSETAGNKYIGCYNDRPVRALSGSEKKDYTDLTTDICINKCSKEGYRYAATAYSKECFCGNSYDRYGKAHERFCNMRCNGDRNQKCGGTWRISVYRTGNEYVGCYNDRPVRALSGSEKKDYTHLTTDICINKCTKEGYRYAATAYSRECFCGNSYDRYGKADEKFCNKPCNGDRNEKCGGTWRISVYRTGNEYIGCYNERRVRALSGSEKKDYTHLTTDICINKCSKEGYRYAATAYSKECFCGNSYDRYGRADEKSCNMPCNGDKNQKCGGFWRISVYRTGA